MDVQQERKDSDCEEINLAELWAKFKPVFAKYKYCIVLAPICFAFLGLGLSKIAIPQWEAGLTLQVGLVSYTELIEPLDNLALRLSTSDFRKAVLVRCGVALGSHEADLYKTSLNVKTLKPIGMIEIKVRGLSRDSTLKLLSVTADEISKTHRGMLPKILSGPKRRLIAIEKLDKDVAATLKTYKQLSTENKSLADIAAAYLVSENGERKLALLDRIDFAEQHPTVVVDENVGNSPVYPRTRSWVIFFGFFGLLVGVAVPAVLYCRKK